MRILLAEDDPAIVNFVRAGLTEEGHAVDVARDGEEALAFPELTKFDIVLLDVMLPGLSGTEVCRRLRNSGLKTPILMLTARDTIEDRVLGLDSGADDYLVKPFAFAELLARVRALLRRAPMVHGRYLEMADLRLDTVTRQAFRRDQEIRLTTKEYALLELFLRNPYHVLTRDQIASHVWNYDFENATNVIDVHVRNLRRKLDDPFPPALIQTHRGTGYVLSDR